MPLPDQPPADANWSTTERATTASAGISPELVSKGMGMTSNLSEPTAKDSKNDDMSGTERQKQERLKNVVK
jgi:hypothetical protein